MDDFTFFHRGLIVDLHIFDFIEGKFIAPVFTEHTDRIGTALAAMAHHVHIAGAGIL